MQNIYNEWVWLFRRRLQTGESVKRIRYTLATLGLCLLGAFAPHLASSSMAASAPSRSPAAPATADIGRDIHGEVSETRGAARLFVFSIPDDAVQVDVSLQQRRRRRGVPRRLREDGARARRRLVVGGPAPRAASGAVADAPRRNGPALRAVPRRGAADQHRRSPRGEAQAAVHAARRRDASPGAARRGPRTRRRRRDVAGGRTPARLRRRRPGRRDGAAHRPRGGGARSRPHRVVARPAARRRRGRVDGRLVARPRERGRSPTGRRRSCPPAGRSGSPSSIRRCTTRR